MFGFLSKRPSCTSYECSDGNSPLRPAWRRMRKECITAVATEILPKKKIFHGECYPCLQERKQEPPGPDRAGTKSKPKRKWLRPASGCGGFSLVVVPSRLQPLCHHKPRRYWTDRVFHKIVLTHKQWLTETVKWKQIELFYVLMLECFLEVRLVYLFTFSYWSSQSLVVFSHKHFCCCFALGIFLWQTQERDNNKLGKERCNMSHG